MVPQAMREEVLDKLAIDWSQFLQPFSTAAVSCTDPSPQPDNVRVRSGMRSNKLLFCLRRRGQAYLSGADGPATGCACVPVAAALSAVSSVAIS